MMIKELEMLMEELEVYPVEDTDANFLATGGYDGDDHIEIVQFTANSSYIVRIKMYERFEEGEVLYFTFETVELLVDFLEENYR